MEVSNNSKLKGDFEDCCVVTKIENVK